MATAAESCSGFGCVTEGIGNAADAAKQKAVDVASGAVNAASGAKEVADTATSFAAFWTDPFGNTFRALQSAAKSLANDILPVLTHATLPDLTAQWWLGAYAVSFALAMFVMVMLLFPNMLAVARGRAPGTELFEQFTVYVPLFLAGAIFGPPLGIFLVKFFGSLTDSIAAWGIGQSAEDVTEQMTRMLADGDASGITGGVVIGIGLMLFMLLGLMLVLLMLIVQLLTLYFTGILFPLAWVWIIQRRTRQFGYKIAFVWVGILASHPLMFLLLGVAYKMIAAQTSVFEGVPSLQRLVTLVVSILALLVAGTAPFTLLKLAPVMPFGNNAAGPSTGGGDRQIGDKTLNETSHRNQMESTDAGSDDVRTSSRVSSDEAPAGSSQGTAPAAGPTVGASGPQATGATSTTQATAGQQAGTETAGGEAIGAKGATGAAGGATAAEGTGAAAGAGAGAGGAAGAATAAEVGGTAAAGAATGGAALGVVAAAYAAKTGYDKTVGAAQDAVDMTAADVDGYDGNGVMEDR